VREKVDIRKLPFFGNEDRGITKETHEAFRVRTELSEESRLPIATYYPELCEGKFLGYKKRKLPKQFSITHYNKIPNGKSVDFFGQDRCPKSGKRLLICAGEEDTLAAYQMLKNKYPEYPPCVVGLPRGESGSNQVIADRLDFISNFQEVLVCMDMDEAGQKALKSILPIIGEGAKVVTFSEKDINEMLIKGKQVEFIQAYYNAKEYRPANIVTAGDILEEAIKPEAWGISYPWEGLTNLTYGLKDSGEIIGIGGAPGCGKSTIWQAIQMHIIFNHKQPIAIFDVEEGAEYGLKKLIGCCLNKPIHKPDCEYDVSKARDVGERLKDLAFFHSGDCEGWDEIEASIRYFASKGIRFFFIDPISALVEHLSASDGNKELGRIMRSMRKFRKHQNLTFFHANHLNNPAVGKEHGEGGMVKGGQYAGSRAQWKYSTLLLGIERNQYAELKEERNAVTLRVIKDRLGGNTGVVKLTYDPNTGTLREETFEEVY
jgi:twinkle protein